jgi:ABC-type transport system involved in multi-copper enzyme maturation permease subunit
MNAMRVLYHLARADFLERVRRYSFLIMLGLVVFLGYSIASGQLMLVVGEYYRGVLNSAWVGGLMAAIVNFFLGLFGFYLIKGSVSRDYETGVGQIMATTPLKRPFYTLGKWLSNFAVLSAMMVILIAVAVVMQLLYREDPVINWWALLAPFLLLVLPFMALTAALAVLFETISWLRGGLGNVVYFFLFTMVITMLSIPVLFGASPSMDLLGVGILSNSMGQAAKAVYPSYDGSFNITWLVPEIQTFRWDGIAWTTEIVVSRLALVQVSMGIAALSAIFFDRFNPSRQLLISRKKTAPGSLEPSTAGEALPVATIAATARGAEAHLTPLGSAPTRSRFSAIFLAEFKLFLKGQRCWWYLLAAGLLVAQFTMPLPAVRILLVVAWVWPILLLSGLGCRESRFDTRQIVFSAPHPLMNQLPAVWLSAFVVIALLGSGALIKFLIMGEAVSALGWLNGALFIPTLALFLGTLTGSSKAFEALFVAWMYLLTQKVAFLDFMAVIPNSPWYYYAPLTLVLLAVAAFARQRQMTAKNISK